MKDIIRRPEGHVTVTARDGAGRIVSQRSNHNIFVDQGREWLASLISAKAVFSLTHPQVIAYMGYGKGGALQDVPAERTAQTENAGVTSLATIVDLDSSSNNLAALGTPTLLVPPTSVQFSRIVTQAEITFPTGPDGVPLSECGLFISATVDLLPSPYSHPDVDLGSPPGGNIPILVAYQQFRTLTKTADISIQFDWELRF